MKTKLTEIMLIDDSVPDTFLTKKVIEKAGVTDKVTSFYGGREALDYLSDKTTGDYPRPALAFLDINMPGMNGWEFMQEYHTLEQEKKIRVVICMLTTSQAERDRQKAEEFGVAADFSTKPLTVERLLEIVKLHFPENFEEE